MALNVNICILFDARESHKAKLRRFWAMLTSSICFFVKTSAIVYLSQVRIILGSNKIRKPVCQKQLQQSLFLWPLAFLHVQTLRLQQAHQSHSQNQLWLSLQHKNTKILSQEPNRVLGTSFMHANGSVL